MENEGVNLLISIFVSLSNGRPILPKSQRALLCSSKFALKLQIYTVCIGLDSSILSFSFIPKRVKIVSEIGEIKREMSNAFNILCTNKANDNICILDPWYTPVNTEITH